jgi:hypothetical protein
MSGAHGAGDVESGAQEWFSRKGCHGHVGFRVLLCIVGVRSPRQLWWTVAELGPIGPGMLDPWFQERGSGKECAPNFLADLGHDVIGGSQDHATLGGVCDSFDLDLMGPGL